MFKKKCFCYLTSSRNSIQLGGFCLCHLFTSFCFSPPPPSLYLFWLINYKEHIMKSFILILIAIDVAQGITRLSNVPLSPTACQKWMHLCHARLYVPLLILHPFFPQLSKRPRAFLPLQRPTTLPSVVTTEKQPLAWRRKIAWNFAVSAVGVTLLIF